MRHANLWDTSPHGGVVDAQRDAIGLEVFKIAEVWPLERESLRAFAEGLDEILVIEESRPILEPQVKDALFDLPEGRRPRILGKRDAAGRAHFHDTSRLAFTLTGNTISANIMLLGFACRSGWRPVGVQALEAAIEANGVAVPYNIGAFRLGRLLAIDPARRTSDLTLYQNEAYARRFRNRVAAIADAEARAMPGSTALTGAAAAE